MALRPEQIENNEFSTSLRGFDKDEVKHFLRRVAASSRELEGRLAENERELQARAATVASLDVNAPEAPAAAPVDATFLTEPPAEPTNEVEALEMAIADRYGALGDRIADLLRSADESAGELRSAAQTEADAIKSDAEAEASALLAEARAIRIEADAHRVAIDAEVDAIRAQAVADGLASLDTRQAEVAVVEDAANADRNQARAELEDVRAQVTGLLEQARTQSEFIKQEAEEIIRTKVRANLSAAQERLDVLRNTEVSSRERILLAQRELANALTRLDAEPMPVLDPSNDREILEEAERRALGYDPASDTHPVGPPTFPGHATPEGVTPSTVTAPFQDSTAHDTSADDDSDDDSGYEEYIEASIVEEAPMEAAPDEFEAAPSSPPDMSDVTAAVVDVPDEAETADMYDGAEPHEGRGIVLAGQTEAAPEMVAAEPEFEAEPEAVEGAETIAPAPGDLASDIAEAQENPFFAGLPAEDAVEDPFSPQPVIGGPEEEDALARLVREAMQEAVDSARKGE